MNTAVYTSTNPYWDVVKDLSVESKLALIHRLNESVMLAIHIPNKKKNTLRQCFGAWRTDESVYSTDELLREVDAVCADKQDFVDEFVNYGE